MEAPILYYIVNARMPTEKAHGLQVAKMCAAFASTGRKVVLLLPKLKESSVEGIFETYKIPASFTVEFVPVVKLPGWVPGSFMIQAASFAFSAAQHLKKLTNVIAYTRGESILLLGGFLPKRIPLIWETHIKPNRPERYRAVAQRCSALVTVTSYYKREIPTLWGVETERVMCEPDAVTLADFKNTESPTESRIRLGLPQDKKIALYIGRVDGWKGTDMLCEAAAHLSDDIQVALIGGEPAQVAELKKKFPRVQFLGYSPYEQLANNQIAADVLVLTGNPKSEIANHYTSPLKLFTYMASGVPIVAVDLPSYRDVLSEKTAFFATPNIESLAETISYAAAHAEEARVRGAAAKELVQNYSWESRAARILDHVTKNIYHGSSK